MLNSLHRCFKSRQTLSSYKTRIIKQCWLKLVRINQPIKVSIRRWTSTILRCCSMIFYQLLTQVSSLRQPPTLLAGLKALDLLSQKDTLPHSSALSVRVTWSRIHWELISEAALLKLTTNPNQEHWAACKEWSRACSWDLVVPAKARILEIQARTQMRIIWAWTTWLNWVQASCSQTITMAHWCSLRLTSLSCLYKISKWW